MGASVCGVRRVVTQTRENFWLFFFFTFFPAVAGAIEPRIIKPVLDKCFFFYMPHSSMLCLCKRRKLLIISQERCGVQTRANIHIHTRCSCRPHAKRVGWLILGRIETREAEKRRSGVFIHTRRGSKVTGMRGQGQCSEEPVMVP